jgi:hypothetical protein
LMATVLRPMMVSPFPTRAMYHQIDGMWRSRAGWPGSIIAE